MGGWLLGLVGNGQGCCSPGRRGWLQVLHGCRLRVHARQRSRRRPGRCHHRAFVNKGRPCAGLPVAAVGHPATTLVFSSEKGPRQICSTQKACSGLRGQSGAAWVRLHLGGPGTRQACNAFPGPATEACLLSRLRWQSHKELAQNEHSRRINRNFAEIKRVKRDSTTLKRPARKKTTQTTQTAQAAHSLQKYQQTDEPTNPVHPPSLTTQL